MKKLFFILSIGILLASCSDDESELKKDAPEQETLIETVGGVYFEYYPGKKQVKITGPVDSEKKRNGRWELYGPNGRELGFTIYEHGKRQGHSYNSYSDARPRYMGEYWADTMIGVWKTYAEDGTIVEKDYGLPEGY